MNFLTKLTVVAHSCEKSSMFARVNIHCSKLDLSLRHKIVYTHTYTQQERMTDSVVSKVVMEAKVEERKKREEPTGRGSGGSKKTVMYLDMYKDGFTGAFVMNRAKYRGEKMGEPVRVAKYMFQCLEPNPPRGCDLEAAKRDPPRGRGWQRVARISKEFLQVSSKLLR